jgi:phospholipid transport system substrate-binding protein
MLYYALMFLIVGLIAGALGLFGIAAAATQIAWVLFLIGVVLLVVHAMRGRRVFPLILLFALSSVHGAWAGPPTDQLRDGVERVLTILRDPELEGEKKANQRRTAVGTAAGEIFDFGEMAKRSLGQHWDQRTPAEREEFVRLFTELMERSYISKVELSSSEKINYKGDTIDGDYAVVRTTILLTRGGEMPLDYKMHNTSDRWQVYDLSIEGVSLVSNYRAQFNKIVRTSSYKALLAKFKSNQAEFSTPSTVPSGGKAAR